MFRVQNTVPNAAQRQSSEFISTQKRTTDTNPLSKEEERRLKYIKRYTEKLDDEEKYIENVEEETLAKKVKYAPSSEDASLKAIKLAIEPKISAANADFI
jgi:hypothetical protein